MVRSPCLPEQFFAPFERLLNRLPPQSKHTQIVFEQPTAASPSKRVAQIVAQRRRQHPGHDDPRQFELLLGKSQKTREQQNRLARQRNARIFQQQCGKQRPVPVLVKVPAQNVENVTA